MKPELIFALPASFCELLISQSKELTPGLYLLPPAAEWQPAAENVLFAQRRETLEKDNTARQLNPYLIPRTWAEDIGQWLYHPYMRQVGSGEEGLFNKVSVGGGGHVDLVDGQPNYITEQSCVSIPSTIGANLNREAGEEFTVINRSTMQQHGQAAQAGLVITEIAKRAIIITNGGVEDRHIGLVTFATVTPGLEVVYKEKGLTSMGPMTRDEILALPDVELEAWTRIVLENLTEEDNAPPAQDEQGYSGLGVLTVSHFGAWCNEVDFFRTFVQRPDSDFKLFEGEDPMEAISRILTKHEVNGLINNCAMARKLISLAAVAVAHGHGQPMLEMLARTDELHSIVDSDLEGELAAVAPATAAMFTGFGGMVSAPEGAKYLSSASFTDQLLEMALELLAQPNKMNLLRILSNTFQTEQNRHRRLQQQQAQQQGRGGMVPAGQMPNGIPRDLMARMAAQMAG